MRNLNSLMLCTGIEPPWSAIEVSILQQIHGKSSHISDTFLLFSDSDKRLPHQSQERLCTHNYLRLSNSFPSFQTSYWTTFRHYWGWMYSTDIMFWPAQPWTVWSKDYSSSKTWKFCVRYWVLRGFVGKLVQTCAGRDEISYISNVFTRSA